MKFGEGMIVRVFCENFRTYSSIECYPGEKLNMIIGQNGSGKSSLVYAIVLGLGGKTTVIGKEKQISAYVKKGCRTAKIEVELFSEPTNYVIGRTFSVDNKSSWMINGEHSPFKAVENIIKKMNIQVDNLCQFLPQDKVQDFAKMDSKQLLENTLKTVGTTEIVNLHDELKQLRQKELNLDTETKTKRSLLESERKKFARLEADVRAIKEREELLNLMKNIEKKKAWIEFEEMENHKEGHLKNKQKVLAMKNKAERDLIPFQTAIEEVRDNLKIMDKSINKEIRACGEVTANARRNFLLTGSADDKIHGINSELQRCMDAEKRKEHTIQTLQSEIENLESTADPGKEAQLNRQVLEKQQELARQTDWGKVMHRKKHEVEESIGEITRRKLSYESAVAREMSAADKKKQILLQRYRDTYEAYEWLQTNRDKFQGNIYGPIMLEINCPERIAKYVEFTIPQRDLVAFVCENKDDMNRLMRTLRDEKGWRINAVQAPANNGAYCPPHELEEIKQFGFWTYLLDEMEGPAPVLNYLCQNYHLHRVPVGTAKTSKMLERIPSIFNFFFSDTQNYVVRTSRFSGEKTSRVVKVGDSVFLAGSTNTALIEEYQNKINKEEKELNVIRSKLDEIKSSLTSYEVKVNELRNQKAQLNQELLSLRRGSAKLQMKKQELELFISQNNIDIDAEKAKAKRQIRGLIVDLCRAQKKTSSNLAKYQELLKGNLLNNFKQSRLQDALKQKLRESVEAAKKVDDFKKMLSNVEEEIKVAERNSKKAYDNALKQTDNLCPTDIRFKRKYENVFEELADDAESLDQKHAELAARADCLAGGRASMLDEYTKTKKAIKDLEAEVADPESQLQELTKEMDGKKQSWLPQVEKLMAHINKNFSEFFGKMNCVGEVSLEKPEIENEFSRYGVCVKVQFREGGRLQKLDTHTQSGGERAVSTAIYMLALQELTTVPFRCVDEINQGMDKINERTVFNLMVETVKKADSAQCFLLTPKILPDLGYSKNVRVLCINCDSNTEKQEVVCIDTYLRYLQESQSQGNKRGSLKRKHADDSDCSDSDSD